MLFKKSVLSTFVVAALAAVPSCLAFEKPQSSLRSVAMVDHEASKLASTASHHADHRQLEVIELTTPTFVVKSPNAGGQSQRRWGITTQVSGDGSTLAVQEASPIARRTFVYTISSQGVTQKGSPIDDTQNFVSLSTDGSVLASCNSRVCRAYQWDGNFNNWVQKGEDISLNNLQWYDFLKLSPDGNSVALTTYTAPYQTYVFTYNSANYQWEQKGEPFTSAENLSGQYFGRENTSKAFSADGNTFAVSEVGYNGGQGRACVFRWDEGASKWNKILEQAGSTTDRGIGHWNYGKSMDLTFDGNTVAIAGGLVDVLQYSGAGADCGSGSDCDTTGPYWSNIGSIPRGDQSRGLNIQLSANGKRLVNGYDVRGTPSVLEVYDHASDGTWEKKYQHDVFDCPEWSCTIGHKWSMSEDGKYLIRGIEWLNVAGEVHVFEMPDGGVGFPGPAVPVGPTCSGNDWCVEFSSVTSTLDGQDTTADITLDYIGSAPIDASNKYYKVVVMDSSCSTEVSADEGVAPIADQLSDPNAAYYTTDAGDTTGKSGSLTVGLDIDTAKVEAGSLTPSDASTKNAYDLTFCAKVDLFTVLDGAHYEVATSKTIVTLAIDKSQGFDFSVSMAQEAAGSDAATVTVNYPLEQCVCDGSLGTNGVVNCLENYGDFLPGEPFQFCIQALTNDRSAPSTEVTVTGLTNVNFENDGDENGALDPVMTVPIVGASGEGVGPATAVCNNGVCVVDAVTYAKLYETDLDGDNVLDDISSRNRIVGTAVLAFKNQRRLEKNEAISVGFGSSVRQLQANDATPVDEFGMDVNLASPPDRSSASAASVFSTVAVMVGGVVGLMMI